MFTFVMCLRFTRLTSRVEIPTSDEVLRTIEAAHELTHDKESPWRKTTALQRSKLLSSLARVLEERIPEMAHIEVLQTGRTIREMKAQLGRLPEWL
jgi:acyl-CoA reductase-like NAD-dependent aldehyde dehydrogenase